MVNPTIEQRLQRKFIVITTDEDLLRELGTHIPQDWTLVAAQDLAEIGEFQDVLLHRFVFLDLDDAHCDPLEIIREMRMELMLNVPIFCFGGTSEIQDEARMLRADRFFSRDQIAEQMKVFCHQYRWGE